MIMRLARSVLPLVILAGASYFAGPVYADGRGGRPAVASANKQPSNPSSNAYVDQRAAKKEARMKQRDQEMDKRMKREKAR